MQLDNVLDRAVFAFCSPSPCNDTLSTFEKSCQRGDIPYPFKVSNQIIDVLTILGVTETIGLHIVVNGPDRARFGLLKGNTKAGKKSAADLPLGGKHRAESLGVFEVKDVRGMKVHRIVAFLQTKMCVH